MLPVQAAGNRPQPHWRKTRSQRQPKQLTLLQLTDRPADGTGWPVGTGRSASSILEFDDSQSLDDITLTQQTLKLDRRPLTTIVTSEMVGISY